MNRIGKHIIHKVFVEVDVKNSKTGIYLKDQLVPMLQSALFPLLEELLENWEAKHPSGYYQIPKIQLQVTTGKENLQNKVSNSYLWEQLLKQVEEQLPQPYVQKNKENFNQNRFPGNSGTPNQNKAQTTGEKGPSRKESPFSSTDNLNFRLPNDETVLCLSRMDREIKSIGFILQHGYKPWWMHGDEKLAFFSDWDQNSPTVKELLNHHGFIRTLLKLLSNESIQNRLISQFTQHQLGVIFLAILKKTYGLNTGQYTRILFNKSNVNYNESMFYKMLFTVFYKEKFRKRYPEVFKELLQFQKAYGPEAYALLQKYLVEILEIAGKVHHTRYDSKAIKEIDRDGLPPFNMNQQTADTKKATTEIPLLESLNSNQSQSPGDEDKEEMAMPSGQLVGQAGLVLVHPFIKAFFEKCDIWNEKRGFIHPELAVHLLHYLATKRENNYDHEMLFEKYCCNVPFDHPIERQVPIPESLKQEATALLEAVRDHWKALKGTGIDTIRSEFLSRPGKLVLHESHPKLVVERRTQDILLDKLPWGIGIIQFPWKEQLLFVEW